MRLRLWVLLGAWLFAISACAQDSSLEEWFQDLPSTGRIWSVLENQSPMTVTEPLDTAGLKTGSLPFFGAFGASWTENQYLLNGFNVTDPYIPGRPLLDPHLDSLSALSFANWIRPPALAGSGTSVQMQPFPAPQGFSGAAQVFYSGSALQLDSVHSEQLDHVVDASVHAGGNLNGTVPITVAAFAQDMSRTQDGFPAAIDGSSYGVMATAVPYRNQDAFVEILYSGQRLLDSAAGADPLTTPAATTRDTISSHVIQLRRHGDAFDAGFGFIHTRASSAFQDAGGDSILELPQRALSSSAPLSTDGTRTRMEAYIAKQVTASQHELHFEARYEWNKISNAWEGRTQHILVNGIEAQTLRWRQGSETSVHVQNFAFSIQDQWKPTSWLTVPAALRLGLARGGSISWTSIEPRVMLQIDVSKKGPQLMGGWARYGHLLQGRYLDFGNESAPGGGVYNGDTLITRFGGAYSDVDQNLKQPYTNEIVAGAEQKLSSDWRIGVRFFRRDDHRMIGLENTGVPDSTYLPTTVVDPGNDGIEGTADDAELILFNRDPSTFGHDFLLLTNPDELSNSCKGLVIYMEKSFLNNWEVSASFVAMKTSGTTNPGNTERENDVGILKTLGTDPNTLLLADSTTFFDRGFIGKLTAVHRWDCGLHLGIVARYYDGLPFGRLLFVNGFNQGPFFVRATPRDNFPLGFRTEFNATLDLRISQAFSRWRATVDLFNLLDLNRNTRESDLTSPEFSSRIPITVQAPFAVRLGLQWQF